MPFVYHVTTYNHLPDTKKIFNCYCKTQEYIKETLNATLKPLTRSELESSIRVVRIDKDKMQNFGLLFPCA